MNIQLDTIHLPSFFSGSQNNVIKEWRCHAVRSMQVLSHYMRYNELTLAGSAIGINLGLIAICEKIMDFASHRFSDQFQNPWVYHSSSFFLQSLVAGGGIYAINRILNLQLNNTFLALSVISSMALKIIWQKVISPEISHWCVGNAKIEEAAKGKKTSEEEVLEEENETKQDDAEKKQPIKANLEPKKNASGEKENIKIESKKEAEPELVKTAVPLPEADELEQEEEEDDVLDDQLMEQPTITPRSELVEEELELHDMELPPSGGTESMLESAVFNPRLAAIDRF